VKRDCERIRQSSEESLGEVGSDTLR
jgi:hypothetical protein